MVPAPTCKPHTFTICTLVVRTMDKIIYTVEGDESWKRESCTRCSVIAANHRCIARVLLSACCHFLLWFKYTGYLVAGVFHVQHALGRVSATLRDCRGLHARLRSLAK